MPVTDSPKASNTSPTGVSGWLLVYVVTTVIGVLYIAWFIVTVEQSINLAMRLWMTLSLVLGGMSVAMIVAVRRPITRDFHIWLNIIEALLVLFVAGINDLWPTGVGGALVHFGWAAYWIGSIRVRATFCTTSDELQIR